MYEQQFDLFSIKPDIVVFNYVRKNNSNLITALHSCGIEIVILDTEGNPLIPIRGVLERIAALNIEQCITKYLLWGPEQYSSFKESGIINANKLVITGCPRYDFAAYPLRATLSNPIPFSDYILVNTNFPTINPKFTKGIADEEKTMRMLGYDNELVKEITSKIIENFQAFIDRLRSIIDENPQLVFVLRPHPFERGETYGTLIKSENLFIYDQGTSISAINNCRLFLHAQDCSTAYEALMIGKPIVSLKNFMPCVTLDNFPPDDYSFLPKTEADLLQFFSNRATVSTSNINSDSFGHQKEEVIRANYYKLDGNSALRAAAEIDSIQVNRKPWQQGVQSGFKRIFQIIIGYTVYQALGRIVRPAGILKRRLKSFSVGDIERILTRINRARESDSLIDVILYRPRDLKSRRMSSKKTVLLSKTFNWNPDQTQSCQR